MKPSSFEYHRPGTLAEALEILSSHGDEAKALAGGQSLVPMLALRLARFDHLVDLAGLPELTGIERSNGHLSVGAMVTQSDVGRSEEAAAAVPLLTQATGFIGHFQIRNRGTVGGSIAHADPAAEYPAVAVALDAELEVAGSRGTRRLPAADAFVGAWTTSLGDEELVTRVHFPVRGERNGAAVEELARRRGDFAVVGVAVSVDVDTEDRVKTAAIALFGVASTPIRAAHAEAALVESGPGADLSEIGQVAVSGLDPPDDVHASGRYRRTVGAVLVARAIARAIEEARS